MEAITSWDIEGAVHISKAIQESSSFPSEDLSELLDEEKCFSLTRPTTGEGDDWCRVRLVGRHTPSQCPAQHSGPKNTQPSSPKGHMKLIKGFTIYSEARVVEVCVGAHDEYLKTVHGNRIGDYEDTEMYRCQLQFDQPRSEILLTLKNTYTYECVWVFGFHVVTVEETVTCGGNRFGTSHLSTVLNDKEVQMSKEAARFRQMLEAFNTSNSPECHLNGNSPMTLMSMFMNPHQLNRAFTKPEILVNSNIQIGKDDKNMNTKLCDKETSIIESKAVQCEGEMLNSKISSLCDNSQAEHVGKGVKALKLSNEETNQGNGGKIAGSDSLGGELEARSLEENQGNLFEKMLMIMANDRKTTAGQQNPYLHLDPNVKNEASVTTSLLDNFLGSAAASSHHFPPQAVQTLMDSVHRLSAPNNNYCHPANSVTEGSEHTTSKIKEADNVLPTNNVAGSEKCSFRDSGTLLRDIEEMIDQKFELMEKRLLRKIEEKIAEKSENDSKRLDRIEKQLFRLCKHIESSQI